jgi:hypothetical protein
MAGNTAIAEASGNYVRRGERELRAGEPLIPSGIALLATPQIVSGFMQACMFLPQNFRLRLSAPPGIGNRRSTILRNPTSHLSDLVTGRRG